MIYSLLEKILVPISLFCCVVYSQHFSPRYLLVKNYKLKIDMVLGSLPKVNLICEGIHERYQKKPWTETSSSPHDATPTFKVQEKISMGWPWWQRPEIAHCSCATFRNTGNPVLETEPFTKRSARATHCRNHCSCSSCSRKSLQTRTNISALWWWGRRSHTAVTFNRQEEDCSEKRGRRAHLLQAPTSTIAGCGGDFLKGEQR